MQKTQVLYVQSDAKEGESPTKKRKVDTTNQDTVEDQAYADASD